MLKPADAKYRVAYFFSQNSGETSLFLALCAILMTVGIVFAEQNNNYVSMYDVAGPFYWIAIFTIYAIVKIYGCFYRTPYYVRTVTCVAGLWAWNYVFLSFVVFDLLLPEPSEFILLIPIVAEVWCMVSLPHPKNWRGNRRKN